MAKLLRLWELSQAHLRVLAYPSGDPSAARRRLVELAQLGVDALMFEGPVELWGVRVVAKGTTSVVLKGVAGSSIVAVKARRLDSNRPSLLPEAYRLRLANRAGIGPRLMAASRNFLVWRFIEGVPLESWVLSASLPEVRDVIRRLLQQAATLDRLGLVHKELSRIRGHVLVTRDMQPVIFDFETASLGSGKSNLTQVAQALFIRESEVSRRVRRAFGVTREEVLEALRAYKRERRIEPLKRLSLI
ncbi:MAG: serine/threonine protein kinase [Thermoprotei archaeon]|nr:MAG: serine/threonine protein kinase [Thermoprotei archaeon]